MLAITLILFCSICLGSIFSLESVLSLGEGEGVKIWAFYYHAYRGERNEFFALKNFDDRPINITGWKITDFDGILLLPNITLAANTTLFVAEDDGDFYTSMGFHPDYCYEELESSKGNFKLSNEGDEIALYTKDGCLVDCVVYGDGNGSLCPSTPLPNIPAGKYYVRCGNSWKAMGIGWSDFSPIAAEANITLFCSPDCAYDVLISQIAKANESIYLCSYLMTNNDIARALAEKAAMGVYVVVLLEGNPVGGVCEEEIYCIKEMMNKGVRVYMMVEDDDKYVYDTYRFIHAKYCIIDNETVVISSENFVHSGYPMKGYNGNRGWGVVIYSSEIARYLVNVFLHDCNPVLDCVIIPDISNILGGEAGGYHGNYSGKFSAVTAHGNVTLCVAPDNANRAILTLLRNATREVLAEVYYIKNWSTGYNPYVEELFNASKRGCKVRLILDGKYEGNYEFCRYIEAVADRNGLDIEARLYDGDCLKIHNKGLVVDDNVVISSINWNENSPTENREIMVIIRGSGCAEYFKEVFYDDWKSSKRVEVSQSPYLDTGTIAMIIIALVIAIILVLIIARVP